MAEQTRILARSVWWGVLVVLVVLALIVAGWVMHQRWEREKVAEAYEEIKLPATFSLTDRRWVAGLDALRLQTGWTYTYDHEGDGVEAAAELTVALEAAGYRMLPETFWQRYRAQNDAKNLLIVAEFASDTTSGRSTNGRKSTVRVAVNRTDG